MWFCWQEKDFKKHQYYLTLLDGGTKDYEEIEDEDEVKVDVFKKNTILVIAGFLGCSAKGVGCGMCLPPKTITAFNFYPPSLVENLSTTPNSSHSQLSDKLFSSGIR